MPGLLMIQKFATLNPQPPVYVRPKGPDGDVDAAVKIADMIHDRGYSTLVANRDFDPNGFQGLATAARGASPNDRNASACRKIGRPR